MSETTFESPGRTAEGAGGAAGDEVDQLDAAAVVAEAVAQRRAADHAEARLLRLAAHWADLHCVLDPVEAAGYDGPGGEDLAPLAGEGAPLVAEFAPAELAAALGMSSYAGSALVGEALELRHRLPRLWQRVMSGRLQAWRARQIAARTVHLNAAAAAYVDAQLAPFAHKIGLRRIEAALEAATIRFDPELAAKKERQAAEARGVWCTQEMLHGTRMVRIEADAADVESFDRTLAALADQLADLGDRDICDVRRAKAVGIIADPQGALDLLASDAPGEEPARAHGRGGVPGVGAPSAATSPSRANRRPCKPRQALLYVHLSAAAVTRGETGQGVARVEDLGPATLDLVKQWLDREDVDITLRPVLDLAGSLAVDAYETPGEIRETVLLRNPCCPFPWCNNVSRRKDMDHIADYEDPDDGGPPGQTSTENLAPLCRRHHRLKTHGRWRYTMTAPGRFLWHSPQGRRYLVDQAGTIPLD